MTDELLDAAGLLIDAGWATGAVAVQGALNAFRIAAMSHEFGLHWLFFAGRLSNWVWDEEMSDALSGRALALVRNEGVLALLPGAAAARVAWDLLAGDLSSASAHVEEQDTVQEAIGGDRSPGSRIALAAFRGREAEVTQLDEATTRDAVARGDGMWVALLHWSTAILCNGLGRYDKALEAARLGAAYPPDVHVSSWALSELVEGAARCGQPEAATDALGRLAEMARACGTDWVIGVEARARALVADSDEADELYRTAIERLGRTRFRTELARAHLLYGEWLRREGRRVDAREHLHAAHDMLTAIGMEAFAERARKELVATGEKARKRTVRDARRSDRAGAADRPYGPRPAVESGDRCAALPQPAHRGVASAECVHQARHPLPSGAGKRAAELRLPAAARAELRRQETPRRHGARETTRGRRRRLGRAPGSRANCACRAGPRGVSKKSARARARSLSVGNVTRST